jgi:hypothetical protein
MLDATASMASYVSNGEDYIITRDTLLSGYEMYLPSTELHIRKPARCGAKTSRPAAGAYSDRGI